MAGTTSGCRTQPGSSPGDRPGVLVGGLKRVRAHDGSLDLVCTRERILKIFRITGLPKVFGIHQTVDQAITATRRR